MNLSYFCQRNRKFFVTTAIAAVLATPAIAQTATTQPVSAADEDVKTMDTVVIVGQRAMMESAINQQRASDTVESVLTRDGIGQFPDQNVAESIRRLPGINILDDQGEGRFVSVRGLDPTLNASSVNGVRLPAPEADTRAVALDVLPSELIQSIQVKKTLTADMDADTIGASIEIDTTKGFDRKKPYISANLEGSYNDLNGETSPKGAVDFTLPVSDTFGISGGLSYYDRKTSTDNQEVSDWTETDDGLVYAEEVQYRDYDVERERFGASLSMDWKVGDSSTFYARGIFSRFDDTEKRQRLIFAMSGEPYAGDDNTASFQSDDGRIRVRRDLKDRFEGQTIQSYQIGGETETGDWKLDYKLAYSQAEEHEHRTQDPTRFQQDFKKDGALAVTFDYSNLETTTYDVTTGLADFLDPTGYEFTDLENVDGLSTDKEWSAKFDAARSIPFDAGDLEIKTGGKIRLRQKDYALTLDVYDELDGYTLADVQGSQTYGLADLGPLPDLGLVRAYNRTHASEFVLNQYDTDYESNAADYSVDEDIYAAYVQGKVTTENTTLIAGVRMEHTVDDLGGNQIGDDGDTITVMPLSFNNDYTDVLPSLNLRYNPTDNWVVRGAFYQSVVRPGIGKLAPRFYLNEDDEGEFGNPDLNPYRATNYDLSAEYYFAEGAVIQAGFFYKDIRDFIVDQFYTDPGTYRGIDYQEATIPVNGDSASVKGLEFNYQQALEFLPGLLDGMLVGFNYTYTDSEGKVPNGNGGTRSIPLPASSENTYNAMIGYDKAGLELRLTAAYRDGYLDELGSDAETDRYVKDHLQIDFSAKYRINEHLQIYGDLVNINDEPYLAYQKGPGRDRLLQYETYSYTAKFGVRYTY
ncbi:MAG TPA: TonB-dependent receptor [Hyphomonas sp.]|nr:TonB-dependent receptor [Hyphomonas sp.]